MILDLQTMFSGSVSADGLTKTGQAITATAISANVLDLSGNAQQFPATKDIGLNPDESWIVAQAQTAAAGGDSAKTLTITLESSSTADLATTPTVHWSSKAITGAQITAGATLAMFSPPSDNYAKFIGLRYTVSAGFTSWNLLAYMTPEIQRNVIYPVGFAVK